MRINEKDVGIAVIAASGANVRLYRLGLAILVEFSIPTAKEEHAVSAYIIADIQVSDPVACDDYRPLAAASIARFGGRFIVRGGKVDLLEGEPQPERIVVIEFPDAGTARRWYQSEEYQTALKIRQAASRGRVLLVEGAG